MTLGPCYIGPGTVISTIKVESPEKVLIKTEDIMYTENRNIIDRAVNSARLTDQSDREIKRIARIYDISVQALRSELSKRKIRYFKAKLINDAQKKYKKI